MVSLIDAQVLCCGRCCKAPRKLRLTDESDTDVFEQLRFPSRALASDSMDCCAFASGVPETISSVCVLFGLFRAANMTRRPGLTSSREMDKCCVMNAGPFGKGYCVMDQWLKYIPSLCLVSFKFWRANTNPEGM